MTIKELRAILANLPDDMPIEHYSERMDSFVNGHFAVMPDSYGWGDDELDCPTFTIFSEN